MPWSDQCGKVMKKPDEYSKNPNTVRARARKARLDPYRRELEQGKAGDRKAISRACKIRLESDEYKMASPEAQQMILQDVERDVMERRRQRGYDAESRMERFLRQHGSIAPEIPDNIRADVRDMRPATKTGGNHEQIGNGSMQALRGYYHAQPRAALHLTPFGSQDDSESSNISPTPYQAVPNIEDAHQDFRDGIRMPAVTPSPNEEYAYGPSSLAHGYMVQLPFKLREFEHKIAQMESTIQQLTYELMMIKRTMATQGKSVGIMDTRLRLYDITAPTLHGIEIEFPESAPSMANSRTLANGVQMLAQVATDIYPSPASGGNDDFEQESKTVKDELD